MRKATVNRNKSKQLINSLNLCRNHPVWANGLKLASHDHALQEDRIDCDSDEANIANFMKQFFENDEEVVENDVNQTPENTQCWVKYGGLCQKDPYQRPVAAFFKQIDTLLRCWERRKLGSVLKCSYAGDSFSIHFTPLHHTIPDPSVMTWRLL